MVKRNQSIEAKNPNYLALSHPDWFLPYMHAHLPHMQWQISSCRALTMITRCSLEACTAPACEPIRGLGLGTLACHWLRPLPAVCHTLQSPLGWCAVNWTLEGKSGKCWQSLTKGVVGLPMPIAHSYEAHMQNWIIKTNYVYLEFVFYVKPN